MHSIFDDRVVLVTGATGSFGRSFVKRLLGETQAAKVIVFSRDEFKQHNLRIELGSESRVRYFLGDVRDRERVYRAFDGVHYVVHAAALKQIPIAEYNPFEFVKTNVMGAQNVIDAAIDRGVRRVVALSTDKASSPASLYGATKLISDKLFVAGNVHAGRKETRFAVVRFGNFLDSRGSVVPLFRRGASEGRVPITDPAMTRFWLGLREAVDLAVTALETLAGGEIYVPKIPSIKIVDLARALAPHAELETIGIRPGEKLHEEMISSSDARRALDCGSHYLIEPEIELPRRRAPEGESVPEGFRYSSETNDEWLDVKRLRSMLQT